MMQSVVTPSRISFYALCLQVAKKNWREYGNPDGKQALEVSMGLPTFLLQKEYHSAILLVYLIIMVVVIPLGTEPFESNAFHHPW